MTDWTIMVYISADNILANFAVESLKQLRDAAGKPLSDAGGDNIVAVAEFDDSQQPHARMYYFDGDDKKRGLSIEESRVDERELEKSKLTTICNVDMTRPETLTEFVNYACKKSKTSHYCLVIWGHGIELLLDESRRFAPSETPVRRYLSIEDLRKALLATDLVNKKKKVEGQPDAHLDIIGLDACSMSMAEVATELVGCADFMVASQEDVPDASFPYENILLELRKHKTGNNVREVCRMIPKLYGVAFEDYVATPDTGVKGITLASLDLNKIEGIVDPLKTLSRALLDASVDTKLRKAILAAREHAQDSVFGLLVDLYDYCQCLKVELVRANLNSPNLMLACDSIFQAVDQKGIVVANQTDEERRRCHGISIYFPYRNENDETDDAEVQFAKGSGRQPLKGSGRQPLKERLVRIQELEADFNKLDEFGRTEWMEFIRHGWSRILAEEAPFELDRYYSAEQVAQNLLSKPKPGNVVAMSPSTGGGGSPNIGGGSKPSDAYRTG